MKVGIHPNFLLHSTHIILCRSKRCIIVRPEFSSSITLTDHRFYLDIYFFFGGWHLLFSVYMIIGIPSTGSAGLIQMIQAYSGGHIAAGILGTFATVGWTLQGVGLAFYYRKVRLTRSWRMFTS